MNPASMFLLAAVVVSTTPVHALESCSASSADRVTPLVELYTSEGCSSCPPADRWLSTQVGRDDINLLAFHVDYWDDIGWPDRFASPAYSRRQRERANAVGDDTVYTPQVMVGGNVRTSWQSSGAFANAIRSVSTPPRASLRLAIEMGPAGLQANLSAAALGEVDPGTQVWIAQYVDGQSSEVRAGENRGETLRHDRVVRKLLGPWSLDQAAAHVEAISPLIGGWGLVAFVQDRNGQTLQSLGLSTSHCSVALR